MMDSSKLEERLKVHQVMVLIIWVRELELEVKEYLCQKIKFYPKEDLKATQLILVTILAAKLKRILKWGLMDN